MGEKLIAASGKRKMAVARAVAFNGNGKVLINNIPLELFKPEIAKLKILEPIEIVGRDVVNKVDIHVTVEGGGIMGQAEAIKVVISNILSNFGGESVHKKLLAYDRMMLVSDSRRTEPKKFGGHSARRRKQKSYR
jgi:small subunit ribosomal protein S9